LGAWFASSKLKEQVDTLTWTGQKKEAINGCNTFSEKAGSGDCKRPEVTLGGNTH